MLVSDNANALEVVKTLSDEYSRKIVLSIISKSLSIGEICLEEHIPISTCYRRIHDLETSGMIRKDETIFTDEGKKFFRYRSTFKNATINLHSGKLSVRLGQNSFENKKAKMRASGKHWH